RLMQAAHDEVVCDHATHDASRSRIAFDALPPIHVKGKAAEQAVYRPKGAADSARARGLRTTLMGRADEHATLGTALPRFANDGIGATVLIEGEAGIGKASLPHELPGP